MRTRHFVIDGTDEEPFSVLDCDQELVDDALTSPLGLVELDEDEFRDAWRETPGEDPVYTRQDFEEMIEEAEQAGID